MIGVRYYIYTSEAKESAADFVDDVLRRSQRKNDDYDITGFLAVEGDHFVQYIEGPADAVDDLMIAIASDPRHKHVRIINSGWTLFRKFGNWTMGVYKVGEDDQSFPSETEGPKAYISFLKATAAAVSS